MSKPSGSEQLEAGGKSDFKTMSAAGLWRWAKEHSGTLALAALLVGVLLVGRASLRELPPADLEGGETPLFI